MSQEGCRYTLRSHPVKGVEILAEGSRCRLDIEESLKGAGPITQKWFWGHITLKEIEPKKGS